MRWVLLYGSLGACASPRAVDAPPGTAEVELFAVESEGTESPPSDSDREREPLALDEIEPPAEVDGGAEASDAGARPAPSTGSGGLGTRGGSTDEPGCGEDARRDCEGQGHQCRLTVDSPCVGRGTRCPDGEMEHARGCRCSCPPLDSAGREILPR